MNKEEVLDELEKKKNLEIFKREMLKGEKSVKEEGTLSSDELKKKLGLY